MVEICEDVGILDNALLDIPGLFANIPVLARLFPRGGLLRRFIALSRAVCAFVALVSHGSQSFALVTWFGYILNDSLPGMMSHSGVRAHARLERFTGWVVTGKVVLGVLTHGEVFSGECLQSSVSDCKSTPFVAG